MIVAYLLAALAATMPRPPAGGTEPPPHRVSGQSPSLPKSASPMVVDLHYQQQSLADIIRDVSHRYGLSLVVDGVPLREKASVDFSGSLNAGLEQIAGAFDYSVRVAILPELPYDPEPLAWGRLLKQFAASLSETQVRAMMAGRELTAGDLSPDQQGALSQVLAMRGYGEARSTWQQLYYQLDRFDSSRIRAQKKGVFAGVNGKSTTVYDVVHETRDPAGRVATRMLGQFQREGVH